jgi:hypothetical protein
MNVGTRHSYIGHFQMKKNGARNDYVRRDNLMRYLRLALLVLAGPVFLGLLGAPRAVAAESQKALEKAAKKACAAGDFRKGVEILAGLYVDSDDTTFIYNSGRCYEQNHQWVDALDRFREYLRKAPQLTASDRADVDKHIVDCEGFLEKREAKLSPHSAPPSTFQAAPVSPAPESAPDGSSSRSGPAETVASPVSDGERPRGSSGLRIAGIVLGSVGVAALAGGLVLNLKANSVANDYNNKPTDSTRSSQSSYKTGSAVLYGVGAGTVVVGVVLYLIGHSGGGETKAAQVSVMPSFASSEFSLALGSTF